MSGTDSRSHRESGFTIVELLIVIVVIAILASISVVAYTGVQSRANDSAMKSGANQIEQAIRIWIIDHPLPIQGGYGSTATVSNGSCSDGSSGMFATGNYVCTLDDALVSAGVLPSGFTYKLPRNPNYGATDGRFATMFYTCQSDYVLYWHLRSPSTQETSGFDSIRTTCGHGNEIRDTYGMRAGKILKF